MRTAWAPENPCSLFAGTWQEGIAALVQLFPGDSFLPLNIKCPSAPPGMARGWPHPGLHIPKAPALHKAQPSPLMPLSGLS